MYRHPQWHGVFSAPPVVLSLCVLFDSEVYHLPWSDAVYPGVVGYTNTSAVGCDGTAPQGVG